MQIAALTAFSHSISVFFNLSHAKPFSGYLTMISAACLKSSPGCFGF